MIWFIIILFIDMIGIIVDFIDVSSIGSVSIIKGNVNFVLSIIYGFCLLFLFLLLFLLSLF